MERGIPALDYCGKCITLCPFFIKIHDSFTRPKMYNALHPEITTQ